MEFTITNMRANTINKEHSYNPKYVVCVCVLFSVLILGRALNSAFFYAFAGVGFLVFVMSNIKYCISFLLFLLPFSTILKLDVDSVSFFTVLFFITIVKMVLSNRKIDARVLLCVFMFFSYNFLFSSVGEITTIVTMIAGMLMLYYIKNIRVDANLAVICFSLGICFSSILSMLKTYFPIINTFVTDTMLKLGENNYASRFSGLQGNPNYYTLDIILALAAIIVIMYNDKPQKIHTICVVALSVFGLMSVSKSFLITWVLLIICWFGFSIKRGISRLVKFIFISVIGAMIVYYFAYDYINTYLLRFLADGSGTISSITTGRTDIWLAYMESIFNDFKILLFGNGLNTILETIGKGTHNTYLESLFSLGIFGSIMLFVSIKICMGKVRLKGAIWLPLIMLVIRIFAIGILTYDNLWFYLAIIALLAHEYKDNQHKLLNSGGY